MSKALIILLLTPAFLAGCATVSKEECKVGNWYQIGQRDGAIGLRSQLGEDTKVCAEVGVAPDGAQYEAGRQDGLHTYCTPANGYNMGIQGMGAADLCPPDVAQAYMNEYNRGYVQYRVNVARNEVDKQDRRVATAYAQIQAAKTQKELEDFGKRYQEAIRDRQIAGRNLDAAMQDAANAGVHY